MRVLSQLSLFLAVCAFVCIAASASAADASAGKAKAENTVCCCGKAVDRKAGLIESTSEGKTHVFATCGDKDCIDEAKNDPKKFAAGVSAHSKKQ